MIANLCSVIEIEWERYPTSNFYNQHTKYSKSDEFAPKKIKNNLCTHFISKVAFGWTIQTFFWNNDFSKHHYQAKLWSPIERQTNTKFTNSIWCIWEKLCLLKVGFAANFAITKWCQILVSGFFLEKVFFVMPSLNKFFGQRGNLRL